MKNLIFLIAILIFPIVVYGQFEIQISKFGTTGKCIGNSTLSSSEEVITFDLKPYMAIHKQDGEIFVLISGIRISGTEKVKLDFYNIMDIHLKSLALETPIIVGDDQHTGLIVIDNRSIINYCKFYDKLIVRAFGCDHEFLLDNFNDCYQAVLSAD